MNRRTGSGRRFLKNLAAIISLGLSVGSPPAFAVPDTYENSLGMQFVLVPEGEFVMGRSESAESLAADFPGYEATRFTQLRDETPAHRVRISHPFFLGRHEVTVGQFRRFVERSGYRTEAERDGTGGYGYNADYDPAKTPRGDAFEGRDRRYSWRNPGFQQTDDDPVVNVTWNDAVALAGWLSRQEGRRYRLPTEAEWEYACRAGGATRYPNGNAPEGLPAIANIFDADAAPYWPRWASRAVDGHDGYAFTAPVGRFAANAFGLHDMLGNVWEWVADWHDEDYYARSPLLNPQGPAEGSVKVRRGGSWHTWPLYARCTFRNWNTPQTRYTLVGIRLAIDEAQPPRARR